MVCKLRYDDQSHMTTFKVKMADVVPAAIVRTGMETISLPKLFAKFTGANVKLYDLTMQ